MKLRWRSTAEEAELVGVERAVDLFTLSLSRPDSAPQLKGSILF